MVEEKFIYRTKMQTQGVTLSLTTKSEMTYEEAVKFSEVKAKPLNDIEKLNNFYAYPLATKENWKRGAINFCPRCGERFDMELASAENAIDCSGCEATSWIEIEVYKEDDV